MTQEKNKCPGEVLAAGSECNVLLVDDQPFVAEAVRRMLADEKDIKFTYCENPSDAIDTALKIKPTVILQDLVMPDIDGLTLVRFFRANPATVNIPLIVLSSKEEPETKAESFALGANDYIVKLPDRLELLARIRYHSRGYIAQLQRNAAYEALEAELKQAADYVMSIIPPASTSNPCVDWLFDPSTQLGGDIFGYHKLDENRLVIYLLDVCGHGVGAALLSVTVMNVLKNQSLRDTDFGNPSVVLARLNESFPMENHNNMYFTIWYGVFDRKNRTITYASGGHPPSILLNGGDRKSAKVVELKTNGFLVGTMPGVKFPSAEIKLDAFSELYVFSDGTYEISKASDGKLWTFEEWRDLVAAFSRRDEKDLSSLLKYVHELNGSDQLDDDFSLMRMVL